MDFKTFLFMVVSPGTAALMVILNIFEIWFIHKHKLLQRVKSTIYILNLAVSDIILGIFIIIVKILKTIEKNDGIDPKYRLFFQLKMIYISLYVSVLTLASLTIERLLAVKKPIFYNMLEFNKKCIICVAIWVVTVFVIFIHNATVNDHEKEYVKTPLVIFTTSLLITVSYVVVFKTLKKRASRNRRQPINPEGNPTTTKTTKTNSSFNKSEKQFLLFCFKSFVIFLICWLPLAAYGIALAGGFITDWKYKDILDFMTHIVAFWNSNASAIMFIHHNRRLFRRVSTANQNSTAIPTARSKTTAMSSELSTINIDPKTKK